MAATRHQSADWRWAAVLAALFMTTVLINPLGFIGGGWDDWQYLNAARCWAEHGPCLPRTHWEGRWPVFLPIAALFNLFGESRLVLGLWPLLCSVAAIALLAVVGNRLMGKPVGWLAAMTFLITPAFSIQILDASVEAVELALVLAGVLALLHWKERRSAPLAFACGLAFGLAFQVRETAMVAAGFAGLAALWWRPSLRDLALAAAGFALPLAIELLVYAQWAGDPLFRRRLSLAHTQLPSSELLGPVDPNHSPFFNKAYIANWKHEPGVHLHWLIDGFANLFVNGKAGFTLVMTPLLLLVGKTALEPGERRRAWLLYGGAIAYAAIIIYVLAMDPKARVMFMPLAAVCTAFAMVCWAMWRAKRRPLVVAAIGGQLLIGWFVLWVHQRTDILEAPAAAWIAAHPGEVMIDPNTRRNLALVPGIEALPDFSEARPYWIYNSVERCPGFVEKAAALGLHLQVAEDHPISNFSLIAPKLGGSLCLLRTHGETGDELSHAVTVSRMDGKYIMNARTYRP